jgi:hypothetical protein
MFWYGWAIGSKGIVLPKDVGLPFGKYLNGSRNY